VISKIDQHCDITKSHYAHQLGILSFLYKMHLLLLYINTRPNITSYYYIIRYLNFCQ